MAKEEEKKSKTHTTTASHGASGSESRPESKLRSGGVNLPARGAGGALSRGGPTGGSILGLGADVSGALEAIAPTFGNILASVGQGVATSQAALDKGVIDTVKALAETKITVVSEVVEELDDDGLPDVEKTRLVTQEVSVLNYVTPTVHEWKHVTLQMDMEVAALDSETGINVSVSQKNTGAANVGLFLGILGIGYYTDSSQYQSMISNSHNESQWAQGRVQMDAVLGPRRTTKFPVPATVTIGPQIYISQGGVVEKKTGNVVTERSIDVQITVRKASGDENPNVSLVLDAAGLLPSFKSDGGFTGSTTNAQGKCQVRLTRAIPNPFFSRAASRACTVQLGDIRKTFAITI